MRPFLFYVVFLFLVMELKRRLLALMLGILFGLYITPKEIYHAFQSHTDTEHTTQSGLQIESAHHHCSLLKADQALCSIEPPTFLCLPAPRLDYIMSNKVVKYTGKPLQGCYNVKKGRGPPTA